ncbi:hypothetical protein GCM10010156_14470 [Planobispora rosea]|uniref:Proline dehydrogenase n=1 Tax=Planobispora rosea TaxID=35762 RepID=A0A8J3RX81_PLARO|nr:(2Fe-2S)-binding protein [Planobispora rosea]GGS56925.1 hypothetical protein GCM10010156_14470 [Planobispora rosea]GIH83482.1 hypothetical protein Pro02_18900 [Planobispora rosea]
MTPAPSSGPSPEPAPSRARRLVRARPEPGFTIETDGGTVPVVPGQTIGAALYGAGIRSWRATRSGGRPRGLFCGIGVCFDCLVTVNGVPSLRACLTEARPGDRVATGDAPARPPERSSGGRREGTRSPGGDGPGEAGR